MAVKVNGQEVSGAGGVVTFNGRNGAVTPQASDYPPSLILAVPTTRTINGKSLSANISLTAANVGAIPSGDVKSIVYLTQAEYSALATKVSTTLYLIPEE